MQISSRTISILKNFALINPSIAFEPGNELQTVAPSKALMGKALSLIHISEPTRPY